MRLRAGIYHFVEHIDGGYAVPGGRKASFETIERWAKESGLTLHYQ